MLDVRYSHLYFYQSLNRLQRGLSAIAELLVTIFLKNLENCLYPQWYAKHSNRQNFISVQDIDTIHACMVGFQGQRNQTCHLKFQGIQESCQANKFGKKISQNCTDFSSAQEIEDFFARIVRFSGSTNSYMLSNFYRAAWNAVAV